MVRMRNTLHDDLQLHVFGCNAHFANLLAKDICNLSNTKTMLSKVLAIMKFLRNTHSALAQLRERSMNKPPKPVETRRNSQQDMLDYFVKNWMEIVCIVSTLPRNDILYRYVEDIHMKRVAQDLLEILTPISTALDSLQKDTTTVDDAVKIWKTLLEKSPGDYKEAVVKRMNDAVSPNRLAANILDHRYMGCDLTTSEMKTRMEYIQDTCPAAAPHVMTYIAQEGVFEKSMFGDAYTSVSATSRWKTGA